ncbi:MAG: transcriptional repressor NrdR [Deltaproteobacteria bacterium]|nr:transcriptional repressor NrdR [Deltaproteobacteria bacterium]
MKCPFCQSLDDKVIDSRLSAEADHIKRRRECESCHRRFNTYERIEEILPMVIKKDGTREAFDRIKLSNGIKKSCEKRPVGIESLNALVRQVEESLQEKGYKEIQSNEIGELVMRGLKDLDDVAYVRFASVYRSFRDINEFMNELKGLLKK